MALRGQHHLLLQELTEVADCFSKPTISHAVRLQKSTQLRGCITRVESVCSELAAAKGAKERAANVERLQTELDMVTAKLREERARADTTQAKLLELYASGPPEASALAARVDELEASLRSKSAELEAQAAAALAGSRTGPSASQQRDAARVTTAAAEAEAARSELRTLQASMTATQKQLWQAREAASALRQERETDYARHQGEVERLRHQIIALERQASAAHVASGDQQTTQTRVQPQAAQPPFFFSSRRE